MGTREPKTSPRRVRAAGRHAEAVALRVARVSYAEIARRLGYEDESGARRAVERELRRTRTTTAEVVEELRQLDLAKLDEMEARLTTILRGEDNDEAIAATRALVGVLRRRAELLGLDAPLAIDGRVEVDARVELERALDRIAIAVQTHDGLTLDSPDPARPSRPGTDHQIRDTPA